jgi:putative sigma-54 modulation protein
MKIVLQSQNMEITDAIRDYVNQKIEKAASHFEKIATQIDVNLSVAKNPRITAAQVAEVTIYANGATIRAEEASEHLYTSIDLVADKIARQLRKYKERSFSNKKNLTEVKEIGAELDLELLDYNLTDNRSATLPAEVVRTKYFAMSALTIDEALAQLQLVDHDFYMYRSAETGEINVIYRRDRGGYGVIQPRPGINEHNGHVKVAAATETAALKR